LSTFARDFDSGKLRCYFYGAGGIRVALIVLTCLSLSECSWAQNFQDIFTNRETITGIQGSLNGNNSTATIEPGEPLHDHKTGGHSLWISWIAPTNGVAKFKTEGSGFDTLIGVYYFSSTNTTGLSNLIEAARADDSEGFERESEVEFGVLAGQRYEVAVDGFFGSTGPVELNWNVDATPGPPPIVLSTPPDRSVRLGETVTLSVTVTNTSSAQFKWFFNGNELAVTSTNLTIPSMQATNIGRYKLRITASGGVQYFAIPTELQINSEGETSALAQSKLLDSPSTPLIGQNGGALVLFSLGGIRPQGTSPIVRGYSGSQIFNTTYGTVDTNEPAHCAVSNGVSYWLSYQPPANGTITLDTVNSTYDTVMEVYTYNGSLTGYQDLIPLDCNNDATGLNSASLVVVPVTKTRQYVVVVEGVNGARGTAWLNYRLDTNLPPSAPTLRSIPTTMVVVPGTSISLAPDLTGSPPLQFSWKKNGTPIPGGTNPALFLANVTMLDAADYSVTVTNDVGNLTATLPLRVVIPPQCNLTRIDTGCRLAWASVTGQFYTVEEAIDVNGPWLASTNTIAGDGQISTVDLAGNGTRFLRIRVQ